MSSLNNRTYVAKLCNVSFMKTMKYSNAIFHFEFCIHYVTANGQLALRARVLDYRLIELLVFVSNVVFFVLTPWIFKTFHLLGENACTIDNEVDLSL